MSSDDLFNKGLVSLNHWETVNATGILPLCHELERLCFSFS